MSSAQHNKRIVEQLRVESDISRVPVSESLRDLINYIQQNREKDPFLMGIDKKSNPFHEPKSCTIL